MFGRLVQDVFLNFGENYTICNYCGGLGGWFMLSEDCDRLIKVDLIDRHHIMWQHLL